MYDKSMLEIKDISKQYKTGDLVQKALDHVSLNLRDNEFVAILGPSGSGKTTLLNIIGGLDRYDSGDLVINGISTKKYKDRDWDSYRNHTIGFVFQSYNLIPHQTVLSNVELALTISGISGSERRARAIEALEKVGLGDQIHKKPNQMSGGQMQRVALARALVNDPDILLADEPTGALDSDTSIQVMDLLKEVAKDRLVVMVTHNPELAEQYANRIVRVKDGHIISDTNPYVVENEIEEPVHKNMGKSSMSFLTALSLSLNNLLTKKARTTLVSFAGSIGIIGIALILALSNGVNAYIQTTEQETLSEYPLEITKSTYSLSSIMTTMAEESTNNSDAEVKEKDVVTNMFGGMTKNDLSSLKEYIESGKSNISDYARSIEYQYDVEPQIYLSDTSNGVKQVNPNNLLANSGIAPTSSAYSSSFTMNNFSALPQNESLYKDSYDVKAGRWPQSYNEAIVVLSSDGSVTDMTLYSLGLKDYSELEKIIESFQNSESSNVETSTNDYEYNDFIGSTLKLVNASDKYTYDDSLGVYSSKENDSTYMTNLVNNGEDLKIVGVVQPKEDATVTMLTAGIDYSSELVEHVINYAKNSEVVKAQLNEKDKNIFTGKRFGEDEETSLDTSDFFTVDESALSNAFQMDTSKINIDISKYLDTSSLTSSASISDEQIQQLVTSSLKQISQEEAETSFKQLLESYTKYMDTQEDDPINSFEQYLNSGAAKQILVQSLSSISKNETNSKLISDAITSSLQKLYVEIAAEGHDSLTDYLNTVEAKNRIYTEVYNAYQSVSLVITDDDLSSVAQNLIGGYIASGGTLDSEKFSQSFSEFLNTTEGQQALSSVVSVFIDTDKLYSSAASLINTQTSSLIEALTSSINQAMVSMVQQLPNALSIDSSAFANAFQINIDGEELQNSLMSMMSSTSSTIDDNLSALGYADINDPSEIVIYPNDFDSKTEIKNILDSYNEEVKKTDESKVITYTDIVGTLMTSVTDIIDVISYVLIAFVAISLVVSSIMIGVITYISVLERQKEIGILRAIGASKHNVSNVFNAETFITGALAGIFGIVITELLLIPGNALIHSIAGNNEVNAVLPLNAAIILILLSIVLTLIGGIIPSKKAAKSDPVKALRTE